MSSQTWLLSIFLILIKHSAFNVTALDSLHCLNDIGNYSRNSIYATNLKALLSSLSSKIGNSGYYKASEGQNPDKAYAEALCSADIQLDECRSCVQNTSGDLLHSCPNQKQAILYREHCLIRYSNESFFGMRADSPRVIASSIKTVRLPDQFVENLRPLLDDLRFKTASGGPTMKVAVGNHTAPALQTIYAMLQCVPDISTDDCSGCLSAAVQEIPDCCYDAAMVKSVWPSCNFRYAISEFYNTTRIQEAQRLSGAATVRAPVPPVLSPPGNGDVTTTRIVIIIVVPVVVCLIVIATCVGICIRKCLSKAPEEAISIDEISTVESLQYDFGQIRAATNDFSDLNKLGEGGFGAVYKVMRQAVALHRTNLYVRIVHACLPVSQGELQNGQEIAVKRLTDGLGQGDRQFKNEVLLLAKLQHRTLVRLLGFALEGKERLLVYEFIQNTSLDHFIFDPIKSAHIDWNIRHKFILGIARGLLYLHEDSRFRIIHCDLKTSNILLDGNMNPKIADFGMARLFAQDESEGNTSRIAGTYGYMAPEYATYGQFSVKIDVFSFWCGSPGNY